MIESVNNDRVKELSKLNDKKYRKINNEFLAPGRHLVEEAIKKNIVKEIFLLDGEENIYNCKVIYVSMNVMKKMLDLSTPPKEVALCKIINNDKIVGNTIILDDIRDPGNLGTIIRSAVAFNYQTIVLSRECVDVYNPKVVRASEGMLFNINIVIDDIVSVINRLKDNGYVIYSTDVVSGSKPVHSNLNHAIVIGSEASGVKDIIKDISDYRVKLPMNSDCEASRFL